MSLQHDHQHALERLSQLTEDEREHFEERAAIRQYDGEMSREEAELAAWYDIGRGER
jgi:hypothetical protein